MSRLARRFMLSLGIAGTIGVALVVGALLLGARHGAGFEDARIAASLDRLILERGTRAHVDATLGPGSELTLGEGPSLARQLAVDKARTAFKLRKYAKVILYGPSPNTTCFVFFDGDNHIVDYELGIQ